MWQKYRNFTVNKLKKAKVCWEPYWHVVVEDILHHDLLHLCNMHWPTDNWLSNTAGLNINRRIYNLQSQFWQEYSKNIMSHTDIQQAVYSLEDLNYTRNRVTMGSLYEDTSGYAVGNHVDASQINIAWQLYISGDTGTNLNDENGTCLKRIPFINNTSWIIRNDSGSWHSCDEITCNLRRTIMVRYMS
tara:strand:- start:489 stop:1052 length:564 start_codon:yes stop_codon:yes gene_type:complete